MKVKVRFIEGRLGHLSVLEVTTHSSHSSADAVGAVLAEFGVEVVHHERRRGMTRQVERWVLKASPGARNPLAMRSEIQARLLETVASIPPPRFPEQRVSRAGATGVKRPVL